MTTVKCDICGGNVKRQPYPPKTGIHFTDGIIDFSFDVCIPCMVSILRYIGKPAQASKLLKEHKDD
jgi:hypothetical protein